MDRLARLRARMAEHEVAAMLVTDLVDLAYVSGFRGSNGALIVTAGEQYLVTDFRYFSQAAEQAPAWELIRQPLGTQAVEVAAKALAEKTRGTIGFVGGQVSFDDYAKLKEAVGEARLKNVPGLVGELRQVKEPAELEIMRRAAEIADLTMARAIELLRPGLTDRQLRADLEYFMVVEAGADKPSFDLIVAAGDQSALPHCPIQGRPIGGGELVTIDLGARVEGYCSDLTRTVAVGSATPEQEELYELVYAAHQAAFEALRPGATGKEVDAVARQVIADGGHGEHFGHGLGHGVGLAIHEPPRLAVQNDQPLVPGNIVTVEPGVYVPGFGGVRIEDLALITDDGYELLSHAPRPPGLRVVG